MLANQNPHENLRILNETEKEEKMKIDLAKDYNSKI
jgi:hypothetical protein